LQAVTPLRVDFNHLAKNDFKAFCSKKLPLSNIKLVQKTIKFTKANVQSDNDFKYLY